MKKLSPKQMAFIDEYLAGVSASRAAIRAGYSEKGAAVQAARLLANPKIAAEIEARKAALRSKTELTRQNVLDFLRDLAFADIRQLYDDDGCIKPVRYWPDNLSRLVQSIDTVEEYVTHGDERVVVTRVRKVRTADRKGVADLALRHFGLLNDRLELHVREDLGERLAKARARYVQLRAALPTQSAPVVENALASSPASASVTCTAGAEDELGEAAQASAPAPAACANEEVPPESPPARSDRVTLPRWASGTVHH